MPRWVSIGAIVSSLVANLLLFALPVVAALLIGLVTWLLGVGREATLVVLLLAESLVMLYAIPARARSDVGRFRRWRRMRRLRQTIPSAALPLDIRLTPERLDEGHKIADAHVKARLPDAELKAIHFNISSSRFSDTERTPRLSIGFAYYDLRAEARMVIYFYEMSSSGKLVIDGEPNTSPTESDDSALSTIEILPWTGTDEWMNPLQRVFAHYRTRAENDAQGLPLFEMMATFFAEKEWRVSMMGDRFKGAERSWTYAVNYAGDFDAEKNSPPSPPPPPTAPSPDPGDASMG